jgi:hypothetical protein
MAKFSTRIRKFLTPCFTILPKKKKVVLKPKTYSSSEYPEKPEIFDFIVFRGSAKKEQIKDLHLFGTDY